MARAWPCRNTLSTQAATIFRAGQFATLFRQASRCEGATHGAQFLALGHSPRHARFSRPVRQAHSARQGIAAGGRRADRDERPDNTRLRTSERPRQLLLWQATNPLARDFRYACGIRYTSTPIAMNGARPQQLVLVPPTNGWRAYFVEATFDDGFVATSQTYILGDGYPSTSPPAVGGSCRTLPGRDTHS